MEAPHLFEDRKLEWTKLIKAASLTFLRTENEANKLQGFVYVVRKMVGDAAGAYLQGWTWL